MLHSPPAKTTLELQLKYSAINLNNQLKASEEKSYNQRFAEEATPRLVGRAETPKGLVLLPQVVAETQREFSHKNSGVSTPSMAPEPGRGTHITSGCEKQLDFCTSGRDSN